MAAQGGEKPQISLFHRSLAAAGASVVSAFLVNPLDVVKVSVRASHRSAVSAATQGYYRPALVVASTGFHCCLADADTCPGLHEVRATP